MSLSLLLATLASSTAALTMAPQRPMLQISARHVATIRMADQEEKPSPLAALSAVPWNNLLLGLITLDCANRLTTGLPALFGPSPNFLGTALDVAFVGYGSQQLLGLAGIGKTDYYSELEGIEVNSFAREAGELALRGEVPTRTMDGRYEVATFAGGCFWGTELHFQRIPGVVATCTPPLAARASPGFLEPCVTLYQARTSLSPA
jgi:hypothetical protein